MKRKMLVGVLVLVIFLIGTAWAGPAAKKNADGKSPGPPASQTVSGIWVAPDNFTTKFWQEKFYGDANGDGFGDPGQMGNVLMAIGQGFILQNAVLTVAPVPTTTDETSWCNGVALTTIYEKGRMTLNPSGPWLKKGTLIDRDVKAINISCHDTEWKLLGFRLKIEGIFEKFAQLPYSVEASFDATPDNYVAPYLDEDGIMVQKGYGFGATITINPVE